MFRADLSRIQIQNDQAHTRKLESHESQDERQELILLLLLIIIIVAVATSRFEQLHSFQDTRTQEQKSYERAGDM